jgi:hypothetical protein
VWVGCGWGVGVQEETWAPCLKLRVVSANERPEDGKYLVTKAEQGTKRVGAVVATKREEREDLVVSPMYVGKVIHVTGDMRVVRVTREISQGVSVPGSGVSERGVIRMRKPRAAEEYTDGYYIVNDLVELEPKTAQELRAAGIVGGCACVHVAGCKLRGV